MIAVPPCAIRPRSTRKGTAAVEFAIIAPVLLILALGMIEVTRAIQVKDYLTDAVRAAGRHAALPNSTNASVIANVRSNMNNQGLPGADATITVQVNGKTADLSTALQADRISVRVSIPLSKVGWVSPFILSATMMESETLVMMRQG